MDHGTVRIVLERVISLPPNVNPPDFEEAIRWMDQGDCPRIKIFMDHFVIAGGEQCDDDLISSRCALRCPLPRELPKSAR